MNIQDNMTYDITELEEGRYSVEVKLFNEMTLGILYFENPKARWHNKPIVSDKLRCVDAKIEGLYVHGGENITPKEIVRTCQDLLSKYIKDHGKKLNISKNANNEDTSPNDNFPKELKEELDVTEDDNTKGEEDN